MREERERERERREEECLRVWVTATAFEGDKEGRVRERVFEVLAE